MVSVSVVMGLISIIMAGLTLIYRRTNPSRFSYSLSISLFILGGLSFCASGIFINSRETFFPGTGGVTIGEFSQSPMDAQLLAQQLGMVHGNQPFIIMVMLLAIKLFGFYLIIRGCTRPMKSYFTGQPFNFMVSIKYWFLGFVLIAIQPVSHSLYTWFQQAFQVSV